MNKILNIKLVLVSIILFLFSGCVTDNLSLGNFGKQEIKKPILEDNILLMPKDASTIILSISAKILHTGKENNNVSFNTDNMHIPLLRDYKLFNFKNALLIKYNKGKSLEADVYFSDTLGRTCGYKINVEYILNGDKITITSYKIVKQYSPVENAVCFVLPAKDYQTLTKETLPRSFYDMYKYAASKAITPQEATKYTKKEEWVIMVFFLDRMSSTATMELGVSNKTDAKERGYKKDSKYIIYDGWKVGLLMGKFHLMAQNNPKPLYAKAFYIPGSESGNFLFFRKERIIGLYKLR